MASDFFLDLSQAPISRALLFYRLFPIKILSRARRILYWIFWLGLVSWFMDQEKKERLGIALLSFSLWALIFLLELFFEKLKNTKPDHNSKNLAEFLSFEVAQAVKSSKNSSEVFLRLTQQNPELQFVFLRLLLDLKELTKILKEEKNTLSQDILEILKTSLEISNKYQHERIEKSDLLSALSIKNSLFRNFLIQMNLMPQDIENVSQWQNELQKELKERKQFWRVKNLRRHGGLAKNWTAGYTTTLDTFSVDLTEIVKKSGFPHAIGHKKEIEALERILARDQINNALLIGEPGSGRRSIILELALRCVLGESLPELNYRRVIELDLPSLFSQFGETSEREAILTQVFSEVINAGNVILVIDELHNFVGEVGEGEERPGKLDITGILSPYLRSPEFPIVAVTTFAGLHQQIEKNPSLLSLFEKIEVSEISKEETLAVLQLYVFGLEKKYKKFISFPALKAIVELSQKYIQAVPFPKKALDLLDEAMVYITQKKDKILRPEHIAEIVEQKTQIPVGEIEIGEKEILLNLEALLHQRIIDQEEAVKEVASALRRARTEITRRKGPIGGFLFLGPTGVGKTETAKALAAVYFGSEERMIRLDMSEFQNIEDIARLLGSPKEQGLLTTPIRENPFSLLLLDEIEKAHPNILNLFLQVLDEGHITDGLGRRVSFQHTIIIATSNAGYQIILQAIKENIDFSLLKERMRNYLLENNIFRPELLNRFDGVLVFKPLTRENLLAIAQLMLKKLQKNLEEKGIEFVISEPLKEKLVELGYDPLFGARPMRRVIQDKVENVFAIALLKDEIKRGDRVQLDPSNFTIQKI